MNKRKITALKKKIEALQTKHSETYLQHFGGEIAQKLFALSMINEQIMFAERELEKLTQTNY